MPGSSRLALSSVAWLLVCAGCQEPGPIGGVEPDLTRWVAFPDSGRTVKKSRVREPGHQETIYYDRNTGQEIENPKVLPGAGFTEGLCPVQVDVKGLWGYADTKGRMVIPPRFTIPGQFHEGVARVYIRDESRTDAPERPGLINRQGEWIVPPGRYEDLATFSEGRCGFKKNGLWGFLDREGREVIPAKYEQDEPDDVQFNQGLCALRRPGQGDDVSYVCLHADTGKEVALPADCVGSFSEGLAAVHASDGKVGEVPVYHLVGYVSGTGETVISPQFKCAHSFREGLARVHVYTPQDLAGLKRDYDRATADKPPEDAKDGARNEEHFDPTMGPCGFIDRTGKMVIPAGFDAARDFSEGLAAVRVKGKWGYVDRTGKIVIPAQFEAASSFYNGLATACINGLVASIDKTGRVVIQTDIRYVEF